MELALNLVWLVFATSSLVLAGQRLSRSAKSRKLRAAGWHSLLALCCTLVILFFVISMTDDIHEQQIVSEDSGSCKLLAGDGAQDYHTKHSHHHSHQGVSHQAFCLNARLDPVVLVYVGYVEPFFPTNSGIRRTVPLSGRAPPVLAV